MAFEFRTIQVIVVLQSAHCRSLLKTFSTKLPLFLITHPSFLLSLHFRTLFLISNRTPRSETCRLVSKRRIHCPNITRRQSMSFTLLCTIQFNITLSSTFQTPNHRTYFLKTSTSHSAQSTFSSQLKLQCSSLDKHADTIP